MEEHSVTRQEFFIDLIMLYLDFNSLFLSFFQLMNWIVQILKIIKNLEKTQKSIIIIIVHLSLFIST